MIPFLKSASDAFDALSSAAQSAGGLEVSRRAAMQALLRDGLPNPRSERWKYTSLRALERRQLASAEAEAGSRANDSSDTLPEVDVPDLSAALAATAGARLVFVNGRYCASLSQLDGLGQGVVLMPLAGAMNDLSESQRARLARAFDRVDEPFARLAAALAQDGVALRVADGVQSTTPVHLVFAGSPLSTDVAWHLRCQIEVGAGASLRLVEHHLATGSHRHLSNTLTDIELAEDATLTHVRVQDESSGASVFARCDARLAARAGYRRIDLELGAALSRHELNVSLHGDNAQLHANGVLLADGQRHVDTRIGIDHAGRDTGCSLIWRGLGAAKGRAAFHGGILIREGADGTDAALSNKNLLLSDEAEIDSQPVLEIHADEVKAAHGATVGQLDPTAMFYLRSRGLPADDARRLLTTAFCREPLGMLDDSALVAVLSATLDRRLHASGAL